MKDLFSSGEEADCFLDAAYGLSKSHFASEGISKEAFFLTLKISAVPEAAANNAASQTESGRKILHKVPASLLKPLIEIRRKAQSFCEEVSEPYLGGFAVAGSAGKEVREILSGLKKEFERRRDEHVLPLFARLVRENEADDLKAGYEPSAERIEELKKQFVFEFELIALNLSRNDEAQEALFKALSVRLSDKARELERKIRSAGTNAALVVETRALQSRLNRWGSLYRPMADAHRHLTEALKDSSAMKGSVFSEKVLITSLQTVSDISSEKSENVVRRASDSQEHRDLADSETGFGASTPEEMLKKGRTLFF